MHVGVSRRNTFAHELAHVIQGGAQCGLSGLRLWVVWFERLGVNGLGVWQLESLELQNPESVFSFSALGVPKRISRCRGLQPEPGSDV